MTETVLLGCGIGAAAVFVVGDLLLSAMFPGYSALDRTVSELNAIDAPTRGLSVVLGVTKTVLLIPFGVGVWRASASRRSMRAAGGALVLLGAGGIWGVTTGSMQPVGADQTQHALSGLVGMVLLLAAMGCAAHARGGWFRAYTIVTIFAIVAAGAWSANMVAAAETPVVPWVGAVERVNFYGWHLWFIGLAIALLKRQRKT